MRTLPRILRPAQPRRFESRREFLSRAGDGFGMLALAGLLQEQGLLGKAAASTVDPRNPLAPHDGHFPAKAKSVIWLFMNGGPSQVDTWDYKPELDSRDGQALAGFDKNTGFFHRTGRPADEVAVSSSGSTASAAPGSRDLPAHGPARRQDGVHPFVLDRVEQPFARPVQDQHRHEPDGFSLRRLVGDVRAGEREPQNLPGFVVMYDTLGRGLPKGNAPNWGAGFLPGIYQGTALKPQGAPIDNLYRAAAT